MMLSKHFSLSELTVTQTGLQNAPNEQELRNLIFMANELLEPVRALIGGPMIVTSAFRSPAVEKKVSGKLYGDHMKGLACDWHPHESVGLSVRECYELIMMTPEIVFDQMIYERANSTWIHIARRPDVNRRQCLIYTPKTNGRYLQYDRSLI